MPLRPALQDFAEEMEKKLVANDHKTGWQNDTYEALKSRLIEETSELIGALYSGDERRIVEEAADVANFCMFLADIAKRTKGAGNPDVQDNQG